MLSLTARRRRRPLPWQKLRHDGLNASHIPARAAALRCRRRPQRPLVLIDVDEPGLADTATRPSDTGAEATVFRADLRDARSLGDVVRQIALAVGPPIVLANVAGIGLAADVLETSDEDGDRIIGVNWASVRGGKLGVSPGMGRGSALVPQRSTSASGRPGALVPHRGSAGGGEATGAQDAPAHQ
ncbi:SDR family NAD(P)-dependent oxidoreductase [Streptomyces sp. NPDC024017]|uniref:SDR family NAD(P)-dependent oxidoreductase n=1 Tax=Streptomyces sp. NPDC024017 TaxID=3154326 RepID=UPI0033D9E136